MAQPRVVVLSGTDEVAEQAAIEFEVTARAAIERRGRFAVALSGGKTPARSFELLASPRFAEDIDWPRVPFFWGDERCVPPQDPQSNYGEARLKLLDPINASEENVHRMRGELDPREGAIEYSEQLERFFRADPILDLVYLGLGPDGHTASLFPHAGALDEARATCVAAHVINNPVPWRLTLTYPVLNAALTVVFLVAGEDKADILARVLEGPHDPAGLPAQGIAPVNGSLAWLVDRAAARRLKARA